MKGICLYGYLLIFAFFSYFAFIAKKFKKNKVVCDPTILLTKEEWEQEAVPEKIIPDKYILCYFLGSNIEHRKFAERLKEKTGYKIVSLNYADEYVKYSDTFADITPYDIGPREWINLIKNAEYVCTDSFHGTVFSLLFNKNFLILEDIVKVIKFLLILE